MTKMTVQMSFPFEDFFTNSLVQNPLDKIFQTRYNGHVLAAVAKWQTHLTQNQAELHPCRFESGQRHQVQADRSSPRTTLSFNGPVTKR